MISHGAETINIYDDTFEITSVVAQNWVDQFVELIIRYNLTVELTCFFRVNDIVCQHNRIKKLINIGLVHIFVGIESFIQKDLNLYNKNTTVKQNLEALKILDEFEISYEFGFIMFNPFTTLDDLLETVQTIKANNIKKWYKPKPISQMDLIIYPGAPIRNVLENKNLLDNSEKGYCFENDDVELCRLMCKKWHSIIGKIYACYSLYGN